MPSLRVITETGRLRETPPALSALVRPLSGVVPDVAIAPALAPEPLAADVATVRLFSGVLQRVKLQDRFVPERAFAETAAVLRTVTRVVKTLYGTWSSTFHFVAGVNRMNIMFLLIGELSTSSEISSTAFDKSRTLPPSAYPRFRRPARVSRVVEKEMEAEI